MEQQLQAPSEPPAAEETEALTSQVDAGRHRSHILAGAGPVPPSDSTEVIAGASRWIVVLFWCRRRKRHTTHFLSAHRKLTLLITEAKTSNKEDYINTKRAPPPPAQCEQRTPIGPYAAAGNASTRLKHQDHRDGRTARQPDTGEVLSRPPKTPSKKHVFCFRVKLHG